MSHRDYEYETDIVDKVIYTAALGVVMAVGSGIVSKFWNSAVDDKRKDVLTSEANKVCTVPEAGKYGDSLKAACVGQVQHAIDGGDNSRDTANSYDSRWFMVASDKQGTEFYKHALSTLKNDVPNLARKNFIERKLWDESDTAVKDGIRNIIIGGEKPFADANINVDLQSLVPIKDAHGQDTHHVTGKFKIVINDAGSKAERVFAYDHATKNASQTSSETNGIIEFNMALAGAYNGYSGIFGSAGRLNMVGNGAGTISEQSTSSIACKAGDSQAACEIVIAVHNALNKLDATHLENIKQSIAVVADKKETAGEFVQNSFYTVSFQ